KRPRLGPPRAHGVCGRGLEDRRDAGTAGRLAADRIVRHYISTGDSVLVEASPYDAIWGIRLLASSPEAQDPMKWRGQNLLGFALMEVRDELRRVTQNEMLCDWSTVWQQ